MLSVGLLQNLRRFLLSYLFIYFWKQPGSLLHCPWPFLLCSSFLCSFVCLEGCRLCRGPRGPRIESQAWHKVTGCERARRGMGRLSSALYPSPVVHTERGTGPWKASYGLEEAQAERVCTSRVSSSCYVVVIIIILLL